MDNVGRTPIVPVSTNVKGRDLRAGYERGLGISERNLFNKVLRDPLYQTAAKIIPDGSGVLENDRANLYLIMKDYLNKLPQGHIIEFGSYRGGNALFMGMICKELYPGQRVYALDTYEGLPKTDPTHDWFDAGDMSDVYYENFLDLIKRNDLTDIVIPVKGLFQDTAVDVLHEAKKLRLAYIDGDIYSSVGYSYNISISYMVKGGYWIFDDPLFPLCIGAFEAVEDLVIKRDGRHAEQVYPNLVYRNL